ncbi:MAG: 50S ribosomal protein L15 [Chlamydiota bacterium]|nr:50S ribosomal protein L15 [Chlamydiota bacterium]
MHLAEILVHSPSKKDRKRIGRGPGSGQGKTAGKGHKGQMARSGKGSRIRRGFEGGQNPLYRRLPKKGFNHVPNREWCIINVGGLNIFREGSHLTPELLREKGVIKGKKSFVRILGGGELKKKLTVSAHHFSQHAIEKIEKLQGKAELIAIEQVIVNAKKEETKKK